MNAVLLAVLAPGKEPIKEGNTLHQFPDKKLVAKKREATLQRHQVHVLVMAEANAMLYSTSSRPSWKVRPVKGITLAKGATANWRAIQAILNSNEQSGHSTVPRPSIMEKRVQDDSPTSTMAPASPDSRQWPEKQITERRRQGDRGQTN